MHVLTIYLIFGMLIHSFLLWMTETNSQSVFRAVFHRIQKWQKASTSSTLLSTSRAKIVVASLQMAVVRENPWLLTLFVSCESRIVSATRGRFNFLNENIQIRLDT